MVHRIAHGPLGRGVRQLVNAWLPALMPAWRFFDRVGPAARIEFALVDGPEGSLTDAGWRELRPRPAAISAGAMVWRLFWNPHWNETLYLSSCAERLVDDPSPERAEALWTRVADIVLREHAALGEPGRRWLHLRIIETMRKADVIASDSVFVFAPRRLRSDPEDDRP